MVNTEVITSEETMAKMNNLMELFQLLDKSNCRKCNEKTCMAFAAAVFQGRKDITECPKLTPDIVARFSDADVSQRPATVEENRDEYLATLKQKIVAIDLAEAAVRTGGQFDGNRLTLKILGKDFGVDRQGNLFADIHVNPWVAMPFLSYVLQGEGAAPSGNWVSLRELKEGGERYPLFQKRCEEAMKRVADIYTDLFDDLVHIFSGRQVAEQFAADISVVLDPLPKVPLMICYWRPEEGLASTLNVFFDDTADRNLDIGSLFSLGAGLAAMFEKLAQRHGFADLASSP
jgi:hypothetical protein